LFKEKRDLFFEIVQAALEEIGLGNAIREGQQSEFVDKIQIAAILAGRT